MSPFVAAAAWISEFESRVMLSPIWTAYSLKICWAEAESAEM